jgi:hypothetical protein
MIWGIQRLCTTFQDFGTLKSLFAGYCYLLLIATGGTFFTAIAPYASDSLHALAVGEFTISGDVIPVFLALFLATLLFRGLLQSWAHSLLVLSRCALKLTEKILQTRRFRAP